ncbi:MAG: hypothetical protein J5858_10200, partial [Lentisphaeria bacterium]|nr:hypothetical protein [Lentisphaeria bacterium]
GSGNRFDRFEPEQCCRDYRIVRPLEVGKFQPESGCFFLRSDDQLVGDKFISGRGKTPILLWTGRHVSFFRRQFRG